MLQGLAKDRASFEGAVQVPHVGTTWRYFATLAALGLFLGVFFHERFLGSMLDPIQIPIASITASLLSLFDIHVLQKGAVLVHSGGFACEITPGCTGLIPLILYVVAVQMYPVQASHKVVGYLVGIPFLIAFNFLRLSHLVYIGAYHPTWFDLAHVVVWQTLIGLSVVAAWWVWTSWSRRSSSVPN